MSVIHLGGWGRTVQVKAVRLHSKILPEKRGAGEQPGEKENRREAEKRERR